MFRTAICPGLYWEAYNKIRLGNSNLRFVYDNLITENYIATPDISYIKNDDHLWECHQNGTTVATTKVGCCSSFSAMISDLDEDMRTHILMIVSENGYGHVMNVFYGKGEYAFFDICSAIENKSMFIESGILADYYKNKYPTSFLHTCENQESFYYYLYRRLRRVYGSLTYVVLNNRCVPDTRYESGQLFLKAADIEDSFSYGINPCIIQTK